MVNFQLKMPNDYVVVILLEGLLDARQTNAFCVFSSTNTQATHKLYVYFVRRAVLTYRTVSKRKQMKVMQEVS